MRPPMRVAIPFVTTSARWDLAAVIVGLPLWWALGIEQFAYPFLLLVPLLKLMAVRRRLVGSPVLVALLVFLVVYLVSALFIVEGERYLTYLKNLATYVTALFLTILVPAVTRDWHDVRAVLRSLALAMGVAAVVGALAIAGIGRGTFASPFGALLPSSLTATALGSNIAERSLGLPSWFAGLGSYFRISSVFLWPTSYAPAIALTLPIVGFLAATTSRRWARSGWIVVAVLMLLNLAFTTGRMAAASLAVGAGYWFLFGRARTSAWTRMLVATAVVAVVGGVMIGESSVQNAVERVEQAVFARGAGSPTSRWTIYARTLEGILERPFLGWGTERNIAGVADTFIYPAGSHSYVLGTLYRQGILGLIAFGVLWWSIWRATAPSCVAAAWPAVARGFLAVGRSVVVAALAMSLTVAFDLDASLMFVWWVIVGCFVAVGVRRPLGESAPEEGYV